MAPICRIEDIRKELNKLATKNTLNHFSIIYLDKNKNVRTRQAHTIAINIGGHSHPLIYNINTRTGFVFVYCLDGNLFTGGPVLGNHVTIGTTDPNTNTADIHITAYEVKRSGKLGGANLNHIYKAFPINQKTQAEFFDYISRFAPNCVIRLSAFCDQYLGFELKGGKKKERNMKGGNAGVSVLNNINSMISDNLGKVKETKKDFLSFDNPIIGTDVIDNVKSVKEAEKLIKSFTIDAGVFGIYNSKEKKARLFVTKSYIPEYEKGF